MRATVRLAAALIGVSALSGCSFAGVNSTVLPGTIGTGDGSYTVAVELPDVGRLTQNAQVKVGNVAVGTVTRLTTKNWHAVAQVSLAPSVRLPGNARAAVGQNSLLGASYLQLAPPATGPATGQLHAGDTIPLDRSIAYPSTEEVLAATSIVLNGAGLDQVRTITAELNKALGGDQHAVADLIPRLNTFVTGLDAQKHDIVTAIDGLDRLSGQLAGQRQVLADAIDTLPPALAVLNDQRAELTRTLEALGHFSDTANHVIDASQDDLVANLRNLAPTLRSLADAGTSLARSLDIALTFPFPAKTVPNACMGDSCNVFVILDLTLPTLDANLLSGTPGQGLLNGVGKVAGLAPTKATAGPTGNPLLPMMPQPPTDQADANPLLPLPGGSR